jgi:hypothetical protein
VRYRPRVDANQKEIVLALRKCGALVGSLAGQGSGYPDLVVQYPSTDEGRIFLLEVKNLKGRGKKLTEDQVEFHRRWNVRIVTSIDEAFGAVGISLRQ